MSKVYKGYELLKAIADGEIKEGTEFYKIEYGVVGKIKYVFDGRNLINEFSEKDIKEQLTLYGLATVAFELIEDETIDIDKIEELEEITEQYVAPIRVNRNKINELVQAVKQLNKEVKSIKEKTND